jgi:cytochrome c peroxidase
MNALVEGGALGALILAGWLALGAAPAARAADNRATGLEWDMPNAALMTPFKGLQPMYFVNRAQNAAEWDRLPAFWNPFEEKAVDPKTGKAVTRRAVKIKVPLGLTSNPPVPAGNPMTIAKWKLGKRLYFDPVLSSDLSVSCSTCHDPKYGFTDARPVSTGIKGLRGGMSAPTVINSAYNFLQFWDGRAASLEDQAQGPVQNAVEMFDGDGHAWDRTVLRVRSQPGIVKQFREVFGTLPTRDGIAKAIATYERTVLVGNAIHDRAELAMRKRIDADDSGTAKPEINASDYEAVLKEAFTRKDAHALKALQLDPDQDEGKTGETAQALARGRALFFGKARCNSCHVGDNFTDNQFHNLGVGVKDGKLPPDLLGRFGAQPTGAKDPELIGAFKTPTLRGLLSTAPYMHDGSETTLEKVVAFYDKGGNANLFLDPKMRDYDAEKAFELSRQEKSGYKGPKVALFDSGAKPVVLLALKLTPQEQKDLVLFLRALQGDAIDPLVGDRKAMPE